MKQRILWLIALPVAACRALGNCIGDVNDEAWALVEEWEDEEDDLRA